MFFLYFISALGLVCGCFLFSLFLNVTSGRHSPVPPGPKPKFISGNTHQLPQEKPWLTYARWSKQYGPVISYRIFNRRTIILNSVNAVFDLLDARSSIYSDRPLPWMVKLAGRDMSLFWLSSLHPRFKKYRKALHSTLNSRAVSKYQELLRTHSVSLMQDLTRAPNDFGSHIDRFSAVLMLRLAYGYGLSDPYESFTSAAVKAKISQAQLLKPGWLIESVPILRFLPAWFPGAGFQHVALRCKSAMSQIEAAPYAWALAKIESGDYLESFTSERLSMLDHNSNRIEEEEIIKWCGAALYAGGTDTTAAFIKSFFLAMTLHPEAQKRAQAEIDQIVGKERLPTIGDQNVLVYTTAILKEVLRWAPVGPLGLPHSVTEDDIYGGYCIPKGSTVIANIWAITRDESTYPDPSAFMPERYTSGNLQADPRTYAFGFGRRACPGQLFVEESMFYIMANILAVFDIRKSIDEHGREVQPLIDFTSSLTSHPKPFQCRISPRSTQALALLDAAGFAGA